MEIKISAWFGGEHIIVNDLEDTDNVVYSWGQHPDRTDLTIDNLLIWHYCDRNVWLKKPGANPDVARSSSGFTPAGVNLHTLISVSPLHLEPSLYWPDCCGMHGFIRNGRWVSV
jgi:hypothetical protein